MALVPAIIAFFILRRSFRLRTKGVLTDGVVVGCDQRLIDSSWCYFPKVEFQSLDGEKYVFTASAGGGRMPRVGRRVRVAYDANDPENADITSLGGISFFAIVLFLFALGFVGVSLICYSGLIEQP